LSVNFYQTTWRKNPEDSHLYTHRLKNLKSHNKRWTFHGSRWFITVLTTAHHHNRSSATSHRLNINLLQVSQLVDQSEKELCNFKIMCQSLCAVLYSCQHQKYWTQSACRWISPVDGLHKGVVHTYFLKITWLLLTAGPHQSSSVSLTTWEPGSFADALSIAKFFSPFKSCIKCLNRKPIILGTCPMPLLPDRLWGPPSLLYSGYRGLFIRG
jgi:hypothetical protein